MPVNPPPTSDLHDTFHYIWLHDVYEYVLFPHTLPSTAQLCSSLLMDGETDTLANLQSYTTWIRDWMAHLSVNSEDILIPPKATSITTP